MAKNYDERKRIRQLAKEAKSEISDIRDYIEQIEEANKNKSGSELAELEMEEAKFEHKCDIVAQRLRDLGYMAQLTTERRDYGITEDLI